MSRKYTIEQIKDYILYHYGPGYLSETVNPIWVLVTVTEIKVA